MPLEKRLYLSPPHMSGKEKDYIEEVFRSNWIAPLGPQVDAFEAELAGYLGVKGALALNSGTAAMHLAVRLLGITRGDQVFCSALTFAASAYPILYEGAKPVFIDSEPASWNMSPAALERALTLAGKKSSLPKALIAVNLYGQSADLDAIIKVCSSYDIPVIEDAAESLGATYRGKKSGSIGRLAILSFNGNKIITTSGGGALVSENPDELNRARYLSSQSRQPARHYEHTEPGYNYRLSNILAAVGRAQLEVLDERVQTKRIIFNRYQEALGGYDGIKFMPEAAFGHSSRWLTVMTVEPDQCGIRRDEVIDLLEKHNIESRPIWKPMQLQPLFEKCCYHEFEPGSSFSEKLFNNGICLPSGTSMTDGEQKEVIELIRGILAGRK